MIEKVGKLREWARRRMQQVQQLPDRKQEEGQQAPPMRLGRQPQNVWQEKEGRLHLGRAPRRGKKRKGRDREEEEVRRRFARPGWKT